MPYLAALTPAHWQVEHIDEEVCPVDTNAQVDLVGITFHTPQRLYQWRPVRQPGMPEWLRFLHSFGYV
jgi:hypothetical protein